MAGKRQHYVPCLLQRGFLHSESEGGERTWLHRNGVAARLVGIRDIGVEDWFYSRKPADGEITLDDTITELEGDISAGINTMRATEPGGVVDPILASRCVVHLVMRTDHIRRTLSEIFDNLFDQFQEFFSDPTRMENAFGLNNSELSMFVVEAIREGIQERAPVDVPVELAEKFVVSLVRENGVDFLKNITDTVGGVFSLLTQESSAKARDTHNKIVERSAEENAWISKLENFRWSIEAGEGFILPDCVALISNLDGDVLPLLLASVDDVKSVIMPISSGLILVGLRPGDPSIDTMQFNLQASAASAAFFISAFAHDESNLSSRIGESAAGEIQTLIREAVSGITFDRKEPLYIDERPTGVIINNESFSYQVKFFDDIDVQVAARVSDITRIVVQSLAQCMPLHDLDGITVARNYEVALVQLDRGDSSLPPIESGALDYAVGVAMPVTVVREGASKIHIVLAMPLVEAWLSEELGCS